MFQPVGGLILRSGSVLFRRQDERGVAHVHALAAAAVCWVSLVVTQREVFLAGRVGFGYCQGIEALNKFVREKCVSESSRNQPMSSRSRSLSLRVVCDRFIVAFYVGASYPNIP